MIGRVLGHYRVIARIGAGGMGEVYRARDEQLEREVALKLLPAESQADENARARQLREARTAAALNHPNICTVFEVGESGGQPFIAMEYVGGRPLSASIPADGLSAETIIRYGAEMSAALAHAHDRGVLHRDLKSSNVVVTTDGHAKILDFGLAKQLGREVIDEATRSEPSLTKAGELVGTLQYLAPELLHGQPADARSDIWALGVVLYEMAAGSRPFSGKTSFEITSGILHESPAPLAARIPGGLRSIILDCLAKEPGQRFQRAGEIHAALKALGSDVSAAAVSRKAKPSGRSPLLIGGAAVLVLFAGFVVWNNFFSSHSRQPRTSPTSLSAPAAARVELSTGGKPSANREANEYFEKAQLFLPVRLDIDRARKMLGKALELDPHFAEARATYAFTHVVLLESGRSNDSALLYKAEEESRQALQDDPNSARAYATLGAVHIKQGRKESARAALLKARALNPKEIDSYNWMIAYHQLNGENAAAQAVARDLMIREPLFFPAHMNLADLLRERGDSSGALRELDKVFEQDPESLFGIFYSARVHLDSGELRKAREVLGRIQPEDRQGYFCRAVWALLRAREGKRSEALKMMDEEVLKYVAAQSDQILVAAEFYAALNEKDKALEWLERTVRAGDERDEWFRRDPLLENIRDHPRFKQILESIAFRRAQQKH